MSIEKILEIADKEDFIKFRNNIEELEEELKTVNDYINVNVKDASNELLNEVTHINQLIDIEKKRFELNLKKKIHLIISEYLK